MILQHLYDSLFIYFSWGILAAKLISLPANVQMNSQIIFSSINIYWTALYVKTQDKPNETEIADHIKSFLCVISSLK